MQSPKTGRKPTVLIGSAKRWHRPAPGHDVSGRRGGENQTDLFELCDKIYCPAVLEDPNSVDTSLDAQVLGHTSNG